MANEVKMVFGSTTTVISLTADVTNTNVAGGTTVLDNSTNLYPMAVATFYNPDGWDTATPTDKSTIGLYMVRQNTDGTDDDSSAPSGTSLEAAEYVGSFLIYGVDEAQRNTITISLAGVSAAYFYIKNNTGATIDYISTPITVKVTPYSYGPAA